MADDIDRDERGRFPPGKSGNTRGRPRKDGSLHGVIAAAANKKVPLPNGRRTRKLLIAADQLANNSARGDHRSSKMLFDLVAQAEEKQASAPAARQLTASDKEIVAAFLAEHRRHLGVEDVR